MRINFENSFWDEYPELIIPNKFNEIYNKDKSKNKSKSSRIMWAIQLHSHPESKLYNLLDKEEVKERDLIKKKALNGKLIKSI